MKATSKVMAKGLVVLPKAIREQVDLKEGDEVAFQVRGRVVEIRPSTKGLEAFAGRYATGRPRRELDGMMADLRGKEEIPRRGGSKLR